MITPYKPQFIEKVLTDQSGRQFRMVFQVVLVDGEVKGKLVSVQPIEVPGSASFDAQKVECLPVFISEKKASTEYVPAFAPVVSPLNKFFFFTSQPTRAPSK